MTTKETIASGHMEATKQQHAHKQVPMFDRRALVVGSDMRSNIGAAIARSLAMRPDFVKVFEPTALGLNLHNWNAEALRAFRADTLVIAAGFSHMDWLEDLPEDQLVDTINVNLTGVIRLVQAYVRVMLYAHMRKKIVIIGSMAYRSVLNASAAYCAAKAGVAHFARCAAWELAPKGFDVYCVHPSNTLGTPMTEKTIQGIMRVRGIDRAAAEAYWGAVLPRNQWLTPAEIGGVVSWLVSGEAAYVSGSNIDLGGGQR